MPEQIQIQNNHSYFARECSLTRNNPLYKIRVPKITKQYVHIEDLLNGGRDLEPRSFFKKSLYGEKGFYLIQDLGNGGGDYPDAILPPDIPVLPNKQNMSDLIVKMFWRLRIEEVLNTNFKLNMPDEQGCELIWNLCCEHSDIDPHDPDAKLVKHYKKNKPYCIMRQTSQYLMDKHTNALLRFIGAFTGHKEHSVVINSRKAIDGYIKSNNIFVIELIEKVREKLKQHSGVDNFRHKDFERLP